MSSQTSDRRRPPAWLITDPQAVDIELGLLKTGKEASTELVERRLGERRHLLARKRYRSTEHRQFRNDAVYRAGRRTGKRREDLAAAKGTRVGMRIRRESWALREFQVMRRLWQAGAAVPYAVSCEGGQVLMEFIGSDEHAAPRLVETGRGRSLDYPDLWRQCVDLLRLMVVSGVVHADLSAYNLLVWRRRLVAIDFPQAVELGLNDQDLDLLQRDVRNVAGFFAAHRVRADADALFADLLSFIPWPTLP